MRAKMYLEAVVGNTWGSGVKAIFHARYDDRIPEDQRFQKATPTAMCEMNIDNPVAIAQLKVGGYYYFDIVPVPVALPAAAEPPDAA